jgi:hypothetical protein
MRKSVGFLFLVLVVTTATFLCAQDKKSKPSAKIKRLASANAIMVVKLTKVSRVSYGGAVGSHFIFEIEEVVKFESGKDMNESDASNFNELLKRGSNLGDYRYLEYRYEYYDPSRGSGVGPARPSTADMKKFRKSSAAHKKLRRLLKEERKYILSAPSTKAFCSVSGAVMPNKWGSILLDSKDDVVIEKYSKTTLEKVESFLKEGEKKPSPELKKKIEGLVKKLGDEKYEAAQKELAKIGKPAVPQLKEALESSDSEVQKRAKEILTEISQIAADLKLTARVNKRVFSKGDKFILTVEWKNVGEVDVVVQRKLKKNPLMILDVKGGLAESMGRWGMPPSDDILAGGPVTIKPGKKVVAKIESDDWREVRVFDDGTQRWRKELRFGILDDEYALGLKKGKYTITVKTKLHNGKEVRSNPVEIEIR